MDTTQNIVTSYCHVPCLYFYVAFFRIHYYKDTYAVYYSLNIYINLIARILSIITRLKTAFKNGV